MYICITIFVLFYHRFTKSKSNSESDSDSDSNSNSNSNSDTGGNRYF